ncbi:MAG: FHIPEP family type III secretion protein, partial [Spirochaetes bacterium]|nr:FHIPEP family type III secretion protein [Spirochaetota bacterium]
LRVHPKIEQEIYKNMELDKEGFPILRLRPDVLHLIQNAIKDKVTEMFEKGFQPVIVTQPQIRKALWEICSHIHKSIAVLSTKELLPDVDLILFGQIAVEDKEKVEV